MQKASGHVNGSLKPKAPSKNNIEELILYLCQKIAANNNLNEKIRDEFTNNSYAYMVKLFCSATSPIYDTFEVSQKIKKKLTSRNRIVDVSCFSELETKFSKLKLIKNHASILQFFLTYFTEQNKYESLSNKNVLNAYTVVEVPLIFENVNESIVDKAGGSKKILEIFRDSTNLISKDQNRLKPNLVTNEGFILRELIYALQGVDSILFEKDPKNMQSIIIKIEMERSVRMFVLRYLECGWLYLRLRKFITTYNNNPSVGLILQAFCAYISAELKEYHRLLAVLESQLGNKDEGTNCGNLTLRRLMVWLDQPLERLKYLNIVCDAVKEKKGGILLSTLHAYSIHGDPFKSALLKSGMAKCAIPIQDMIFEWICDGQIRDIHEEFFVAFDNSVPNDRLWHDKYNLRMSQIPTFISEQQARKILVIGKSINFMRVICNEQKQIKGVKNLPSITSMLDQKSDTRFQEIIDTAYEDTSMTLIQILMKKYKLLDHFNSLRRYLLLGQGDFINHLMDLMEAELCKPANDLMFHNLQRLLDKAITETNAQYDPQDIISRLDVRLLTSSPNDVGWDVFSLDYTMDGPLKTVFTTDSLTRYLRIFNFLWRVKRMEYTICATWRFQKSNMEKFRGINEIYEIIHQSNIISSEMLRLVQNLNFYIMFEVLECSWKTLSEKLNEAKDMDQVISANENFIETIVTQLLLDPKSKEIASELRTIFDLIVKISSLNENFHVLATNEVKARNEYQLKCVDIDEMEQSERERIQKIEKTRYHTEVKPKIKQTKHHLNLLRQSFQDMVKKLLEMLKNHHNESLRFLSFRFNFNEYYN